MKTEAEIRKVLEKQLKELGRLTKPSLLDMYVQGTIDALHLVLEIEPPKSVDVTKNKLWELLND